MGVASEQVLADLFHIDVEDPFLTDQVVAQTILVAPIIAAPSGLERVR